MLQICWEGIFQGLWLTSLKTFIVANIVSSLRRSLYTWWNSLNIVTAQFFFFFFSFYFSRIVISIGAILIAYVSTKRKWSKILFMLTDAVSIACVAGSLRFRVSFILGLSFSSPPPKPRAASNVSYCKHLFLCLLLVLLYIWSIDLFT